MQRCGAGADCECCVERILSSWTMDAGTYPNSKGASDMSRKHELFLFNKGGGGDNVGTFGSESSAHLVNITV